MPAPRRVRSPKWRTERAARRWRSPEERGVSDVGAREAGSATNKAVVLPHKPRGSKRLPTDHCASRFCSPENWRRREVMLPISRVRDQSAQTGAGALSGLTRCARPSGVDLRSIHLRCAPSPPKVPAAGFAPASIRLEDGGLSFSATRRWSAGARKWRSPSKARVSRAGARLRAARRTKWTSRRDSHPQHGVRSAA